MLRSEIAWSKFRIGQQLDHHKGFQVHNPAVFLELTGGSNYVAVRLNRLLHLVRSYSNQMVGRPKKKQGFFFLLKDSSQLKNILKLKIKKKKKLSLLNLSLGARLGSRYTMNYYSPLMILPSIMAREAPSFEGKMVFS